MALHAHRLTFLMRLLCFHGFITMQTFQSAIARMNVNNTRAHEEKKSFEAKTNQGGFRSKAATCFAALVAAAAAQRYMLCGQDIVLSLAAVWDLASFFSSFCYYRPQRFFFSLLFFFAFYFRDLFLLVFALCFLFCFVSRPRRRGIRFKLKISRNKIK